MTGTVRQTQVAGGEPETFGIVLEDGRLVSYADGSPKYRQVTEAVKAGSAASMLVRPLPGGADLLVITVDGRHIASVRDAAKPYRDGIRFNRGIATVSGSVGLMLMGYLAMLIWRPPHRGQRRPGALYPSGGEQG